MKLNNRATQAVVTVALAAVGTSAMAAGSDTGVEAGFHEFSTDLETIVRGAGGYAVMILSIVVGVVALAITGNWRAIFGSLGAALVLGYGVQMVTGLGSITASTELLETPVVKVATEPIRIE